jgi:uncharacterized membrane protein YczE
LGCAARRSISAFWFNHWILVDYCGLFYSCIICYANEGMAQAWSVFKYASCSKFMDLYFKLLFMVTPLSMEGKLAMFASGLIINDIGMGIYISTQLGAGPRDSFMLAINSKTGWKISHVRRGMEIIVLIIGWFLGGPVSFGTIIVSLVTGMIIGYTLPACQCLHCNG